MCIIRTKFGKNIDSKKSETSNSIIRKRTLRNFLAPATGMLSGSGCVTHLYRIFLLSAFAQPCSTSFSFAVTSIFAHHPNSVRGEHSLYEVGDFVQHRHRSFGTHTLHPAYIFLPVLITLIPLNRVVAQPCDTALTCEG